VRIRGSFPIQAILLLTGIVLALRLVTRHPSGFLLFQPDLLGAALFLYTPFLYYRRGRAPSWIRLSDAKRSGALILALGAGGALVYLLVSSLPFPLFPPPGERTGPRSGHSSSGRPFS